MKALVISNLYDILYDELDKILIREKNEYEAIIFLGNIDVSILKHIKYFLIKNDITKHLIGVEGNDDIEGTLESIGIKNIHLKYKSLNGKKLTGFSGSIKSNEPSTHPTYTQSQAYELINRLNACDILITHNTPRGFEETFIESGFGALTDYIKVKEPSICLCSHKHLNSINLYNSTYIIGINGIAIIDFDLFTLNKLY